MLKQQIKVSVVVPVFNEEGNLRKLVAELQSVLDGAGLNYELLLIDDGSTDRSPSLLKELAADLPQIKIILLRRNFGQTAAMAAGFDHARGEVIVPMDGDLQNDPRDIPRLLEKIEEGYDVVSGWRRDRKDKMISRRLPSMLANSLISRMTKVPLHDYGCTLKAYRSAALVDVNLYGELHRFVPALASQFGARVTEITVNHRPRMAGKSKYGIERTLRVVLDLLTVKFLLKYSTRPMQLFGLWGFWAFAAAGVSGLTTLWMKLFEDLSMNRNPLLVLTAFLFFSGVQFLALGLVAELVTRTYHETQNKPVYVVRQRLNF
jgi:glycosyltransferase involved in cell wall biosynthesis